MHARLCKMCWNWHDLDEPWPLACSKIEPDMHGPYRVHVISDTMQVIQGQHDGNLYESKSKLRASYRAQGMIEVGNDPARFKRSRAEPDRRQIRAALERAKSQYTLTN